MTDKNIITISHFSDTLCVWAYIAQIRIDELKNQFKNAIELQYHFFPVFASVDTMLHNNWEAKGGIPAFNKHLHSLAEKFDHIEIHPDIWLKSKPATSLNSHLYIKAVQLIDAEQQIPVNEHGDSASEDYVKRVRLAFFKHAENIADTDLLLALAEQQGLARGAIESKIKSGQAFAAFDSDLQLAKKFNIMGSPTLVFNEGRQSIYGNVGYRVIEANIRELLNQPENQASWC